MKNRGNEAQSSWQVSAAGLVLGMALGLATGAGVAVYVVLQSSAEYLTGAIALPLAGVLMGAVCGGAAGIAGTIYTSMRGRLPGFWLAAMTPLFVVTMVGALFTAFSRTGWMYAAALAAPASIVWGWALPVVAERFRGHPLQPHGSCREPAGGTDVK